MLIADLEQQIADNLVREKEERERAVEEAKKAAGAFPTLLDSIQQPQPQRPQQGSASQDGGRPGLPPLAQATHKVVSLRTKPGSHKVVVSSYTPSPTVSRPASGSSDGAKGNEPRRVPPPSKEPKHAARVVDPSRPWENLLGQM